jgi:leucyl-tRNA synthetase
MFIGPFDQVANWSDESLMGVNRFLIRMAKLFAKLDKNYKASSDDLKALHTAIKEISERIEQMKFNTCISALMILLNYLENQEKVASEIMRDMLKILSPFAPHLAEEMWHNMGEQGFVSLASWPEFKAQYLQETEVNISVQVNGKLRGVIRVANNISQDEAVKFAKLEDSVKPFIEGKEIKKIIFVPNRILSFVV